MTFPWPSHILYSTVYMWRGLIRGLTARRNMPQSMTQGSALSGRRALCVPFHLGVRDTASLLSSSAGTTPTSPRSGYVFACVWLFLWTRVCVCVCVEDISRPSCLFSSTPGWPGLIRCSDYPAWPATINPSETLDALNSPILYCTHAERHTHDFDSSFILILFF